MRKNCETVMDAAKKLVVIMFFALLIFDNGCSKNNPTEIDYSNIENLYEQPLEVIQESVKGKWRILFGTHSHGFTSFSSTVVDIAEYFRFKTP